METKQHNALIGTLFAMLITLVGVLGLVTWNLYSQVNDLQRVENRQNQTASTAIAQTTQPQAIPAPSAPQNGSIPQGGNSEPSLPANPFSSPFDDNWSGFMDPADSFAEMQQRMDELMNSMTRGFPFFNQEDFGFGFISQGPAVSMTEDGDSYRVVIDIPEGQEVEVKTELDGNFLMVSGSVRSELDRSASGLSSRSMQESRFSQSIHLPEAVDEAAMTVERNANDIVITLPKKTTL